MRWCWDFSQPLPAAAGFAAFVPYKNTVPFAKSVHLRHYIAAFGANLLILNPGNPSQHMTGIHNFHNFHSRPYIVFSTQFKALLPYTSNLPFA
jgi:hypothetical protein